MNDPRLLLAQSQQADLMRAAFRAELAGRVHILLLDMKWELNVMECAPLPALDEGLAERAVAEADALIAALSRPR